LLGFTGETMNQFLLPIFGLVLAGSAIASEPIIDVLKLAGKSKPEVESALGKPSSCKASKYGDKCSYIKGQTEIVFIGGKADWITIEDLDSVSYSPSAIESLGLKAVDPAFKNNFTIRWEKLHGLLEVSIFPAGNRVDYAYVKVYTK
jgi:hypothetical protein